MKYHLLSDPLISISGARGIRRVSLPGLFAAMARREVDGFSALRPHQNAAWHMFLVQLAALALWTAEADRIVQGESAWRDMLRKLTPDFPQDEPWHLVVQDMARPAFLQPPRPADPLKRTPISSSDEMDLLVTSKNFDIKQAIAYTGLPEDWLYALVSLQTMQGFSGRQNYGIARMNGGSANRPLLGLAPGHAGDATVHPSAWWMRDVSRLMSSPRDSTEGKLGGPALLWCLQWAEDEQLQVADLDPWFIEVCRRVRLRSAEGRLAAERSISKKARINASAFSGNLGDPWTAINTIEGKSFTASQQGFPYEKVCELLFSGNWRLPLLARHGPEETGDMVLMLEVLVRGDGRTEGFHSRRIPVPKKSHFASVTAASVSNAQIEDIAKFVQALRNALVLVALGGDREARPGKSRLRKLRDYAEPAIERFQKRADDLFFETLWDRVAAEEKGGGAKEESRLNFLQALHEAAKREFRAGMPAIPCPATQRLRAETRAEGLFRGGIRKQFPELFEKEGANAKLKVA